MHRINRKACFIAMGCCLALFLGGIGFIHSREITEPEPQDGERLPLLLSYRGEAPSLERPSVAFDHDRHTKTLGQSKEADCKICHVLEVTDERLVVDKKARVYKFPKLPFDPGNKKSIMEAFHAACGDCHADRASKGLKAGPDIGLCAKCHVKESTVRKVVWPWSPLFNYGRHHKHREAVSNKCETCHHTYDEKVKKLIWKKDTENSCRACHGVTTVKNARAMKEVAHAACVVCHMKLAAEGRKKVGPFECKGCHGEHKTLTPEEILKIPRLVRAQKDVMDLPAPPSATETPSQARPAQAAPAQAADPSPELKVARMKAVQFNHKSHEPRVQFCSTCHHYSLEKCINCHSLLGDPKKGDGITLEQAFHRPSAKRSCAGCHMTAKQDKKCAGCHQRMPPGLPGSACAVCHAGPSGGVAREVAPLPLATDKEKVPEKVQMKELGKDYNPAELPHMKIVNRLTTISNESSLARWFHSAPQDLLCLGCHHKTLPAAQMEKKWPKCISCHGNPFNQSDLSRPGLMRAYHQQCMGCHQTMLQKPTPLECDKCHPVKSPLKVITKTEIPLRGYGNGK